MNSSKVEPPSWVAASICTFILAANADSFVPRTYSSHDFETACKKIFSGEKSHKNPVYAIQQAYANKAAVYIMEL
jgi:hypothetical protein